jgi:hypothetical protein
MLRQCRHWVLLVLVASVVVMSLVVLAPPRCCRAVQAGRTAG